MVVRDNHTNPCSGGLSLSKPFCHVGSWQRFGNVRTKNLLIEGGRNGVKVTVDVV
jgi:CDGSH-type Zn-finger protein